MARESGFPRADAENDFLRVRRLQVLSALAAKVRGEEDVAAALSFDEVVSALGRRGERRLGVQLIPLDAIVGSVDRVRDFDRRFRPTSSRSRERWQRLARANRKGESVPPIDVYRLGDYYFVKDGHHRVSVARALGLREIDADVTIIDTFLTPVEIGSREALERKRWRKVFLQRVPLVGYERDRIKVSRPISYGVLAEMVEAWATRTMQAEGQFMDKSTMAHRWYSEEFAPVMALIEEAGVRGEDEREADAYMRVAGERYRLIREHEWDREVMDMIASSKSTPKSAKAKAKAKPTPKTRRD